MSPEFLDTRDVIAIHRRQIEEFGGLDGLRDVVLLESAVAQPMAMFQGHFLHADVFEMAAAYLFHIASNHPFLDGNKRAALAAALIFLALNGAPIETASPALYDLTITVAEGKGRKEAIAELLRSLATRR